MGRCPKCRTWKKPVRSSDSMTAEGTLRCPRCFTNLRASLTGRDLAILGAVGGLPLLMVAWFSGRPLLSIMLPLFTAFLATFIDVWEVVP